MKCLRYTDLLMLFFSHHLPRALAIRFMRRSLRGLLCSVLRVRVIDVLRTRVSDLIVEADCASESGILNGLSRLAELKALEPARKEASDAVRDLLNTEVMECWSCAAFILSYLNNR